VVGGLETITDRLLKWCHEFTRANAWAYFYFVGTNMKMNLPENLDRLIPHDAPNPEIPSRRDCASARALPAR